MAVNSLYFLSLPVAGTSASGFLWASFAGMGVTFAASSFGEEAEDEFVIKATFSVAFKEY
jgi:hypothetical protein